MPWSLVLMYFLGGAFLANALPHLLAGLARRPFPTPFASPPFKGQSSPSVNIAWALANLAVAYLLLLRIRALDIDQWPYVGAVLAGFTVMALQVVRSLRRS